MQIKDMFAMVMSKLDDMSTDIGVLKSDVGSLKNEMSKMKSEIKSMENKFDMKLTNLSNNLNSKISKITDNMGNIHERSFRQSLEARFGTRYVRSFEATNLIGLGRLVAHKKQHGYNNTDALYQIEIAKQIASSITEEDINRLYSRMDKVIDYVIEKNKLGINRKVYNRNECLNNIYNKIDRDTFSGKLVSEMLRILSNENSEDYYFSTFGFAVFVSRDFDDATNIPENHGYQTSLELDCRGMRIDTVSGHIFDFAEIKSNDSNESRKSGFKQLVRAAKIIKRAITAISDGTPDVQVIGRLFLNSNENELTNENLVSLERDGIRIIQERSKSM
jgi:Skp family chaperone for outer membrane proteins